MPLPLLLLLAGAAQAAQAAEDAAPPAEHAAPPAEDAAPPAEDAAPPAADEGWFDLPAAEGDFGSALDALGPAAAPPAPPVAGAAPAPPAAAPPPPLRRGRFGLRPRLSVVGAPDQGAGLALGGSLGHQWWALTDRPVRGAGETRLDAAGRLAGAQGFDVRLVSAHGLWLGPVGVLGGAAARWDRLVLGDATLPAALSLGPQLRLALDLGPVLPWAALTPAWVVLGERGAAELPLGDELSLDAGVDLDGDHLTWRLSGSGRRTAAGPLWEAGLGLHLHF